MIFGLNLFKVNHLRVHWRTDRSDKRPVSSREFQPDEVQVRFADAFATPKVGYRMPVVREYLPVRAQHQQSQEIRTSTNRYPRIALGTEPMFGLVVETFVLLLSDTPQPLKLITPKLTHLAVLCLSLLDRENTAADKHPNTEK